LVMFPNANGTAFSLKISSRINPVGGLANEPCRLLIPYSVYNDLEPIRNNSIARILYDDFYEDRIMNIASKSPAEKSFNFNVSRPRFLFIIPSLADSVTQVFQNPLSSQGVTCSPHRVSQLQITIGSHAIFTNPLQYGHEFFHHYNMFMGNDRDGNALKSAEFCGLVTREMYDLMYGVIVVYLLKCSNENLDSVAKNITIKFKNESGVTMNYTLIMSAQFEMSLDRILCQLVKPNNVQA